jgi:hypothetical protein
VKTARVSQTYEHVKALVFERVSAHYQFNIHFATQLHVAMSVRSCALTLVTSLALKQLEMPRSLV